MSDKRIIIVNGPSGVGKSTISNILSREVKRGVHIDVDILRHLVANYRLTHEQVHLAYRNAASLANNFLDAGYTVIVDGVFPTGHDLRGFCQMLKAQRIRVYVYTLSGKLPVLLQREAMKVGSHSRRLKVKELYQKMEKEADRLGVKIDTTDLGVMETVAVIRQMVEADMGRLESCK
jgi:predicted kinase